MVLDNCALIILADTSHWCVLIVLYEHSDSCGVCPPQDTLNICPYSVLFTRRKTGPEISKGSVTFHRWKGQVLHTHTGDTPWPLTLLACLAVTVSFSALISGHFASVVILRDWHIELGNVYLHFCHLGLSEWSHHLPCFCVLHISFWYFDLWGLAFD